MPWGIRRRRGVDGPQNLAPSDPNLLTMIGWMGGGANYSGEPVTEDTALTLSALWRASMLIAGTAGGLPLKTYTTSKDDERKRVTSFLDNPGGDTGQTAFEWKQTAFLHLVLHGEAPLLHRYNQGGALAFLENVHPLALDVKWAPEGPSERWPDGKMYDVSVQDGDTTKKVRLSSKEITVVPGPLSSGLRGLGMLSYARNSLGITLAAEKSAAKMFANGSQINGVLVPAADQDLSIDDVEALRADLDSNLTGVDNAGKIPIVNKVLSFQPWAMTNLDAQFLESRKFQIEEIARWTGVPPHLLMQGTAVSNWGTGVLQQNKNLSQYVLRSWTIPVEERLSRLLPAPRFAEFDYAALEAGSASDEIDLILKQVNGGFITANEGRRVRNLEPLAGGDELRVPSGVMLQKQLEASADNAEAELATTQPTEGTA